MPRRHEHYVIRIQQLYRLLRLLLSMAGLWHSIWCTE
jgi:hypothetical protein